MSTWWSRSSRSRRSGRSRSSFSIPYAGQSAVLIAPKTTSIKGPDDLKSLKVGVTRGALEDGALTQMNPAGMNLLRFDDGPSVSQAMLSGQIDAMGGGDYGEIYLRKGAKGEEYEQKFPLRAAHFGIGIRRGNPELLQWLNTFVYQIKNSGELDAISRKYRNGQPDDPAAGLLGTASWKGCRRTGIPRQPRHSTEEGR